MKQIGCRWRCSLVLIAVLVTGCSDARIESIALGEESTPPFTVRGRWPDPTRLRYHVDTTDGLLPNKVFGETIEQALGTWADTGRVGFVKSPDLGSADVIFRWGKSASESRPKGRFGRETSVAMTGPVGPGCNVWFDVDQAWKEAGGSGPALYQAAVHEIGHALGLGHSSIPASVMFPQRENGQTELAASDLHGLHSLYGGGVDGPGDLMIEGSVGLTLRRVAPPSRTDWTLFDSDGDGAMEVIVWTSGSAREGSVTLYHFGPGAGLLRTSGPILGIAGYGVRVECVLEKGKRYLDAFQPDGSVIRRRFDEHGFPGEPHALAPRSYNGSTVAARTGDLDGDGFPESVRLLEQSADSFDAGRRAAIESRD